MTTALALSENITAGFGELLGDWENLELWTIGYSVSGR